MREKQRAIQQFREESLNFEEDSTNKSFFVNLISFINTRLNRIKENPITIDDKVALKKRHEQITNNLQSLESDSQNKDEYERIHNRKEIIFFIHYVMFLEKKLHEQGTETSTQLERAQGIKIPSNLMKPDANEVQEGGDNAA